MTTTPEADQVFDFERLLAPAIYKLRRVIEQKIYQLSWAIAQEFDIEALFAHYPEFSRDDVHGVRMKFRDAVYNALYEASRQHSLPAIDIQMENVPDDTKNGGGAEAG